jgi:hypothetical protein
MDLDIRNLEQDKFSPQISGVDTFIPMDYDIYNAITNVYLEPAVTGSSGISIL